MPIPDKIAAAKKIDALLRGVVTHGSLHLKYRITVDPPVPRRATGNGQKFWSSFPDLTLLWSWNGAASCCVPSKRWRLRCSACLAMSMRRSASTA